MSPIERLKLGSELKSTLSIGKLFQRLLIDVIAIYLELNFCPKNIVRSVTSLS